MCQPLLTSSTSSLIDSGVFIIPNRGIDSLARFFNTFAGAVVSHYAREEISGISVANDSFRILQTLRKSMRNPTSVMPVLTVLFRDSIGKVVLAMLASILSSELIWSDLHSGL